MPRDEKEHINTNDFFQMKHVIYKYVEVNNTKGTFHAKMGSMKDRNAMDLTEAEDTEKRWQEYTEELNKNIFMIQISMMV